ncbi:MAG: hypothetical protein HOP10_11790 [Chitinophagaceae bacterium]|nr:hypothetical protein [Chitinophagaceae bacterium]
MKTMLVAIIVVLSYISCGKQSAVSKKLSGCDSLVIIFNKPNTDEVVNMVSTTDKKAIRKLTGFLDGKEMDRSQCGYDGHMIFYKNGQRVMPVVFNFNEKDCHHFLFDIDNKNSSTIMSNEEMDFLTSLKEGKTWY